MTTNEPLGYIVMEVLPCEGAVDGVIKPNSRICNYQVYVDRKEGPEPAQCRGCLHNGTRTGMSKDTVAPSGDSGVYRPAVVDRPMVASVKEWDELHPEDPVAQKLGVKPDGTVQTPT